jgi:hypothetical protein
VCRWVPPAGEGGPPSSSGYYKTQQGGSGNWSRFNSRGRPIFPEEAHPNSHGHEESANPSSAARRRGSHMTKLPSMTLSLRTRAPSRLWEMMPSS